MRIDINNLVRQTLPPHQRKPNRLGFLWALLRPLRSLWNVFVGWRKYQRMLVNVYGCKIVLEGFLRGKFNNTEIYLISSKSTLPRISLRVEGSNALIRVGLRSALETSRFTTSMRSESVAASLGVDILVICPEDIDATELRADIEHYKPHFATYKMVVNCYLVDDKNQRLQDDNGNYIIITIK